MSNEAIEVRTIKARLKRIARHNEDYEYSDFDIEATPISFVDFPVLGERWRVSFNKPDKGYWITTVVTYLSFQDGKILFGTKNSVYELTSGWEG